MNNDLVLLIRWRSDGKKEYTWMIPLLAVYEAVWGEENGSTYIKSKIISGFLGEEPWVNMGLWDRSY